MDFVSNLAKQAQPEPDQANNPDLDKSSKTDLFSSTKVVADAAQSQLRQEDYDKAKAAGAGADLLHAASEYGKLDDTQGIGNYVNKAEGYLRQYGTDSNSAPAAAAEAAVDDTTGTKISDSDESAPVKTLGVDGDSDVPKSTPTAAAVGDSEGLKTKSTDTPTVGDSDDVKTAITDSSSAAIDDSTGDIKSTITTGAEAEKASTDGVGDYVKKAEGFLSKPAGDDEEKKPAGDYLKEEAEGAVEKPVGGYLKDAEGVLSKSGDDGEKTEAASETKSGGGFGNVMKMAGGFLKK